MTDNDTTVQQLKNVVAEFIRQRDWMKYHRPKNLAMSIAIEVGELLELFQWEDHEECEALVQSEAHRKKVADEMCDLLAYLLSLANVTGIDLASSFVDKMRRNALKYPVEQVKGTYEKK